MACMQMRHVIDINESWHVYVWISPHISVMSYARMWHVTDMNESRHTVAPRCAWYTHVSMSRVICTNESRHANEWVMLHAWMSHVIYTSQSWHQCKCVTRHTLMSHVTNTTHPAWYFHVCVIWLIQMCKCVTWLVDTFDIEICDMCDIISFVGLFCKRDLCF